MSVASFLLHHRHDADKCGVAFAAFKGHPSPLRQNATFASCACGGHEIWWVVEADSEAQALALLPHYVAQRCSVTAIRKVEIP